MTVYRPTRSPYYHFDFTLRGQRYHGSTGLTSKTEARSYEAKVRREAASGEKAKPQITLDEAIGLWWAEKGKFEANSATTKGQGKRLIKALGGGRPLTDIESDDFKKFIARRRGSVTNRGTLLSNATVNREIELAARIWRHVAPDYAVSTIDWSKLKLKEAAERVRELSEEEEARFWAAAPDEDLKAVAEFALLSGQRRTSIITLLWRQVDFDAMRATVRIKGGAWHTFPLTPRLVAIIANQPRVAAQVFTYVCARPSPPRGDRPRRLRGERYPFSKQGWYRKWYAWLERACIEDFRFHDLRHTRGTRMLRATGNLKAVQKLLGHTDIATTARYAHALEDDVRTAMISGESRTIPDPAPRLVSKNGRNPRGSA